MLDASALLAFVNGEPGGDLVPLTTGEAMMSAVNLSESISVMITQGMSEASVRKQLASILLEVLDFDRSCAENAGFMIQKTKPFGLSLGDRACLATALDRHIPALTGDHSWSKTDVGVAVKFIR